jgi:hypothetical protein
MIRSLAYAIAVTTIAVSPAVASAQTCAGAPAITSASPVNMGANAGFNSDVTTFGATLSAGTDKAFGAVGVSRAAYDIEGLDGADSTILSVVGGLQFAPASNAKIAFCPVVAFQKDFGPNDLGGSGIDVSSSAFGGGGSLGLIAYDSGTMKIIPTAGVRVYRATTKLEFDGASASESDTVGLLNLGVGFLLNERFSVIPTVQIPFGVDDGKASFGVAGVFSFGK